MGKRRTKPLNEVAGPERWARAAAGPLLLEHCPTFTNPTARQGHQIPGLVLNTIFSPLDTLFLLFLFNNKNKPLFVYLFTVGKNYLIPCWFCMFAHWQRNDQSIIFMFIWTVRDRITTTTKNIIQRSYKLICILMSEINIWPLRKTWLGTRWQNPCWQSQRSDVSCSWPPSLHTSQEGFCPTPLCRSSPSH